MKWITKIISVEPYKVTCKWNANEVHTIEFKNFLKEKASNPTSSLSQLLDKDRFSEVKCDGMTLYWENGIKMKDLDGKIKSAPLDIDSDVLFSLAI